MGIFTILCVFTREMSNFTFSYVFYGPNVVFVHTLGGIKTFCAYLHIIMFFYSEMSKLTEKFVYNSCVIVVHMFCVNLMKF